MALSRRPPKTHDEPTQPPLEMPRPIQRPSARAPAVTGPAMATPAWGLCYSGSLTHGGQPGSPTPCCRLLAHPLLPPKMARSPAVEPVARGDRSRGVRRVGPCLGSSPGGLSFSVTQAWSLCDCDSACVTQALGKPTIRSQDAHCCWRSRGCRQGFSMQWTGRSWSSPLGKAQEDAREQWTSTAITAQQGGLEVPTHTSGGQSCRRRQPSPWGLPCLGRNPVGSAPNPKSSRPKASFSASHPRTRPLASPGLRGPGLTSHLGFLSHPVHLPRPQPMAAIPSAAASWRSPGHLRPHKKTSDPTKAAQGIPALCSQLASREHGHPPPAYPAAQHPLTPGCLRDLPSIKEPDIRPAHPT